MSLEVTNTVYLNTLRLALGNSLHNAAEIYFLVGATPSIGPRSHRVEFKRAILANAIESAGLLASIGAGGVQLATQGFLKSIRSGLVAEIVDQAHIRDQSQGAFSFNSSSFKGANILIGATLMGVPKHAASPAFPEWNALTEQIDSYAHETKARDWDSFYTDLSQNLIRTFPPSIHSSDFGDGWADDLCKITQVSQWEAQSQTNYIRTGCPWYIFRCSLQGSVLTLEQADKYQRRQPVSIKRLFSETFDGKKRKLPDIIEEINVEIGNREYSFLVKDGKIIESM